VHGDPVTITSGTMTQISNITSVLSIQSADFDVAGFFESGAGIFVSCFPCAGSNAVVVSTLIGGSGSGRGTIDGVTYPHLELGANLSFIAPSIILPTGGVDPGALLEFTLPFTMNGFLSASPGMSQPSVLRTDVVGQGQMTADFLVGPAFNGQQLYSAESAIWTFGESPAATPEPTTLVLLCGGGAMLLRGRRGRRRA